MANTYSIIRKQQAYINPYDVQDIEKTLAVKEGRYNSNVAQVNSAIAQFTSVDLIREEDQDYLYNNLKKVIDIVDDTDNIDFSRTGLGSELGLYISQAIDKNVLKQAANTKAIRNYNSGIQEIKEEDPELYSSINDYDARQQAGYYEYLSGEKNSLGSLNYVTKTDVQDNLLKKAKQLKDLNPKKVVEIPDPDNPGYMKKTTIEGLTQSEWLSILPTMLTEQDRAQLAINGRVRYNYDNELAVSSVQTIKDSNTQKLNEAISDIDAQMSLISDDATKAKLKKEKDALQEIYTKTNAKYDLIGNTAGKIGGYFIEQDLINNLAGTLGAQKQIEYSTDDAYFKRLAQAAENKEKMVGSNSFADANNDGAPDFQTTATPTDTSDIGNVLKQKEDQQRQFVTDFGRKLATIYNGLSATDRKNIDSIEKGVLQRHNEAMSKDSTLKPLTDMELHRQVIDLVSDGDNNILSLREKVDLKSDMDKIDAYNKAKTSAFLEAENMIFNVNAGEIYEELTTNPNIQMFTDGNGKITFNQFLKAKDIKNKEDLVAFLNTDSEESKIFRANFLIQTSEQLGAIGINLQSNPEGMGGENALLFNRDLVRRLTRAKELLGETQSLDEIFSLKDYASGEEIPMEDLDQDTLTTISLRNPNSRLAKILTKAAITHTTAGLFGLDKTLRQESHIFRKFDQDNFTEQYEKALNIKTANIAGQNVITIQPSGTRKGEMVPAFQELITKAQPIGLVGINTKLPINLSKNTDGSYALFQNQEGDDGLEVKLGVISAEELSTLPSLSSSIDLYENRSNIDFQTEIRSEVPTLNYISSSAKKSRELQTLFDARTRQGRDKINMASKDGVLDYLGSTPSLRNLNDKQKGPDYVAMVQKVINNPNRFNIRMDSYDGISNIVVEMDNGTGERVQVDAINISESINQREFMDMYYATPQIFLTLALENIGSDYIRTNNSTMIDLINNNL